MLAHKLPHYEDYFCQLSKLVTYLMKSNLNSTTHLYSESFCIERGTSAVVHTLTSAIFCVKDSFLLSVIYKRPFFIFSCERNLAAAAAAAVVEAITTTNHDDPRSLTPAARQIAEPARYILF